MTDRINSKKLLYRVKEETNILPTVNRRKTNWIGHIWPAKWLLQHIIQGKIEVTRRRGRRRKQLPDNVKEGRR